MLKKLLIPAIAIGGIGQVSALNLDLTDDLTLDADVSLTYGGAVRVADQDATLLADTNADDGNRSFAKGDLVNNKFSSVIDIDLRYKNFGVFMRPRAFYDLAYDGTSANDSATNNNLETYGGELSAANQFSAATIDVHRDSVEILDLFAYADFDIAGRYVDLRAGRQMMGWGESIYLQNSISSAQNPLDVTASNAAGTELSEIFLPVAQAYGQADLTSNLSVAGYYQWEWQASQLDEQGSYFSTSDIIDNAGERFIVDASGIAIDRVADITARDDGQWGVSFRYIAEALNGTEFGFYAMNYHDKYPMIVGEFTGGSNSPALDAAIAASAGAGGTGTDWAGLAYDQAVGGAYVACLTDFTGFIPFGATSAADCYPAALAYVGWAATQPGSEVANGLALGAAADMAEQSSYHLEYAEDIKLFGASFGTSIGSTNVGGEVSYRSGVPLQVTDAMNILGFSYVKGEVVQAQLSAIHVFGPSFAWDSMTFTGEFGVNQALGFGEAELVADELALGGKFSATFDYLQLLAGLDLKTSVEYEFNPMGTSVMTGSFEEGADEVTVGATFSYRALVEFGVSYTDFLGDADVNGKADRDLFAFTANYTF